MDVQDKTVRWCIQNEIGGVSAAAVEACMSKMLRLPNRNIFKQEEQIHVPPSLPELQSFFEQHTIDPQGLFPMPKRANELFYPPASAISPTPTLVGVSDGTDCDRCIVTILCATNFVAMQPYVKIKLAGHEFQTGMSAKKNKEGHRCWDESFEIRQIFTDEKIEIRLELWDGSLTRLATYTLSSQIGKNTTEWVEGTAQNGKCACIKIHHYIRKGTATPVVLKLADFCKGMKVKHTSRGVGVVQAVDDAARISNPKVHVHYFEGDKSVHRFSEHRFLLIHIDHPMLHFRYNQASINSGKLTIVDGKPSKVGNVTLALTDFKVGNQVEHITRGVG